MLSGSSVFFGTTVWVKMPLPPRPLPLCPLLPWLGLPLGSAPQAARASGALTLASAQFPRLLNAARSYRGNWKNTGRRPHPRALARPRGRISAARACCLGGAGAWGGEAGEAAGAGGCLPVSGSGRGLVCQRLPPPAPRRRRPPARPPGLPASRPPAAAAARSPRGLAGCRLHRRGFAPFSRPLRLPELIWELFISCQKAAGPAKQTTLAAGPPGLARRGRPGLLAPGPRAAAASLEAPGRPGGRAAGAARPPIWLHLEAGEEASSGLLPAKGCGKS